MNFQQVAAIALIWVSSTVGAVGLHIAEIYIAATAATIVMFITSSL